LRNSRLESVRRLELMVSLRNICVRQTARCALSQGEAR
jgi:hypothetical protein